MDKKRASIWIVVVAALLVLLYVFASPTGNVISDGSSGVLNVTNESEGNESEEVFVGLSPGEIGECGDLNESGTYTLNASVVNSSSGCFIINVADVVVDCDGNSISGGIQANANSTVLDCTLDSLSVADDVSVDVSESMGVSVVNQKNVSIQGASVVASQMEDNVTTSLGSASTNEDGLATVNVLRAAHVGSSETVYSAFDVEVSLDGFNGSTSSLDNVSALNVEITDILAPVVVVESPSSVSSEDVRFSFEVEETGGLVNCTAYVKEGTSVRGTEFVDDPDDDNSVRVEGLDDETVYKASAECFDSAGLLGTSNQVEFTTDEDSSSDSSDSDSGSSSGSGSSSESSASTSSSTTPTASGNTVEFNMTYQVTDVQFNSGYTRKMFVNEAVGISVNGNSVSLQLIEVAGSSVKVTDGSSVVEISSDNPGRFDTDSDGLYDVLAISGDQDLDNVFLTFLSISEAVPEEEEISEGNEDATQGSAITGLVADENADEGNKSLAIIVVIVLLALIFVIYRWVKLKKGNKVKKNDGKRGAVNLSDEDDFNYSEAGNSEGEGNRKKVFSLS